MGRLRLDVQQRAVLAARQWIDVDSATSEKGSFQKLLKDTAGYSPVGSSSVRSFEYSRVSVPGTIIDGPLVQELLPAEDSIYLKEFEARMLLPTQTAIIIEEARGLPGCHRDPVLLTQPRAYARLVKRCLNIRLVSLTGLQLEAELGISSCTRKATSKD